MQARWRDMALTNTQLCSREGCYNMVVKPRRVCTTCKVTTKGKVVQGQPCNKGRNARGIAAHKPDKIRTKRAKRQIVQGNQPREVTAVSVKLSRVIRSPKEEIW